MTRSNLTDRDPQTSQVFPVRCRGRPRIIRRTILRLLALLALFDNQLQPGRVVSYQLPQLADQQSGKTEERKRNDEEEAADEEEPGPPGPDPARVTGCQLEIHCAERQQINVVLQHQSAEREAE